MYSVVLLMALSGSADTPALGHGCKGGCDCGGWSCASSCGGWSCDCAGSCHKSKHHGRMKGCHGGHGGHGGHGCHSSCHGGYGCAGGACHGGCGGYTMPPAGTVIPVVPQEMKKSTSVEPAPATIIVSLPASAKLMVDGNPTTSTSDRRVFVSPALDRGMEYFYTLKAEVVRDGKTETRTEKVTVRAGEETKVQINFANPTVAAK